MDTVRIRCDTIRDTIHWLVIIMAPPRLIGFVSLSSLENEGVMERSWLAGARWSECNLGSFCCVMRYPFIWHLFAASCLNLGSSCCEEEERRRLGNICRSLITCRPGRRRPRAVAPAGGPPLMAAAPASPPGPTGSLAACETPEVDRGGEKFSKKIAKRNKNIANTATCSSI